MTLYRGADANQDGMVDGNVGSNGVVDTLETAPDSGQRTTPLLDTDADGSVEARDLDSDGDGTFDLDEAGGSAFDGDADGRVDSQTDADGDGILQPVDANEAVFGFPSLSLA